MRAEVHPSVKYADDNHAVVGDTIEYEVRLAAHLAIAGADVLCGLTDHRAPGDELDGLLKISRIALGLRLAPGRG